MAVSAVKIRRMSFFEAPIARGIPISFVRSRTEMYVIIAIIIDDTIERDGYETNEYGCNHAHHCRNRRHDGLNIVGVGEHFVVFAGVFSLCYRR